MAESIFHPVAHTNTHTVYNALVQILLTITSHEMYEFVILMFSVAHAISKHINGTRRWLCVLHNTWSGVRCADVHVLC